MSNIFETVAYGSKAIECVQQGQVTLAAKYFLAARATRSGGQDFSVPVASLYSFLRRLGIELSESELSQLLDDLAKEEGITAE